MPTPKIAFATLGTEDFDAMVAFYRDWFDLGDDKVRRDEDNAALMLEGCELVLYPRDKIAESAGEKPAASRVPATLLSIDAGSAAGLEELVSRALAAGGSQPSPPIHEDWGVSTFIRDPEGHLWELVAFAAD